LLGAFAPGYLSIGEVETDQVVSGEEIVVFRKFFI
jgi:hypothetical protein